MLVISPHLDDAVLSCADWIAAHPVCTVLTVFAGTPGDASQCTDWDRRCGFANAAEAVAARRDEDRMALSLLGARPMWLGFADSQYAEPADDETIAASIAEVLRAQPDTPVLLPLGLFHSDHLQVHRAGVRALHAAPHGEVHCYEDGLYRRRPGRLQRRLAELHDAGTTLTPARHAMPAVPALKQQAVNAYASQLRGLDAGGLADTALPERCWRLEAPETPSRTQEPIHALR